MVSCYFIGYFERSRGYKFYDPTTKSIFETGNARFFEDVEFDRGDKDRDFFFLKRNMLIFPQLLLTLFRILYLTLFKKQIQIKTISKNLAFQKNKLYLLQNLRH